MGQAGPAGPEGAGEALLGCVELVACDQCWHLAGGSAGVAARLVDAGVEGGVGVEGGAVGGPVLEPMLVFDPVVEALLEAAQDYDLLHPIDRLLVESGIRWPVLRHIAVPARMQLAGRVLRSPAPAGTRSADSARCWLDAVETALRAQPGYMSRRRRWWRVALQLACAADRDRRPLTWMTQEEIAAVIGCSTRTVRRVVAWLRAQGLLWEVVPGSRLPQQHVPDGETDTEAAQRRARMAAAVAAEQAAITRARAVARAELDAVRTGHRGAAAAATAQLTLHGPHGDITGDRSGADVAGEGAPGDGLDAVLVDPDDAHLDGLDPHELDIGLQHLLQSPLVNLAPVYELRVPTDPTTDPTPPDTTPPTSTNTTRTEQGDEFGHPPQVYSEDQLKSRSEHPVDKRRAPRGPYKEVAGGVAGPGEVDGGADGAEPVTSTPPAGRESERQERQPQRQSRAVRTAQRLLRSRLDVRVCQDVSVHWLAGQLRASGLLEAGWTEPDLVDLLHGTPEYTHLPRHVRNARGWIRTRLRAATPTLPPSQLRTITTIERSSPWFQTRHRAAAAAAQQAEITARRATIDACPLCDELGWLHVDHNTPTSRCTHDPATGGW